METHGGLSKNRTPVSQSVRFDIQQLNQYQANSRAMEMSCSLISEGTEFGVTHFSCSVSLEAISDKMLVFLVKIFMGHDVRGAGVDSRAVRLKNKQKSLLVHI